MDQWHAGLLVKTLLLPSSVPQVAWIMGSPRRIPDLESVLGHQWLSVSHAKVGGCTTARGVFRLTGVDPVVIPHDLTRTLSHIVKFSVRSSPCHPQLDIPHFKLTSKLSIQRLDLPILVPSDFSSTGWGRRLLESVELAAAFELPEFLSCETKFQEHLVPLQLLRVVMDEVITGLQPLTSNLRSVRRRQVSEAEGKSAAARVILMGAG